VSITVSANLRTCRRTGARVAFASVLFPDSVQTPSERINDKT
jgi:hypothetical protein